MNTFSSVFIYTFVSLFSIINPIGMSGIFLELTKGFSNSERYRAAYLVALYGAILLLATFFIGPFIIRFFGISLPSIQVAGGLLVFYTAWGMLQTKPQAEGEKIGSLSASESIFFPLTMPVTAGAGSIAVTIALAEEFGKKYVYDITNISAVMIAVILVFIVVGASYRYAYTIFNKLGKTGASVVSSLSAFILLAIGVTVIWEGIGGLISTSINK
jgi:multiple antibiotic resistance protein